MILTKTKFKQFIKEEIIRLLGEGFGNPEDTLRKKFQKHFGRAHDLSSYEQQDELSDMVDAIIQGEEVEIDGITYHRGNDPREAYGALNPGGLNPEGYPNTDYDEGDDPTGYTTGEDSWYDEGDDPTGYTTGEDWDEADQDRSHASPYTNEVHGEGPETEGYVMTDADWADVGGRENAEQYFPNQPPAAVTRASELPVTSSMTQSVAPVDTEYTASITDPEVRRMHGSDILRTTPVEHTESFSYQK